MSKPLRTVQNDFLDSSILQKPYFKSPLKNISSPIRLSLDPQESPKRSETREKERDMYYRLQITVKESQLSEILEEIQQYNSKLEQLCSEHQATKINRQKLRKRVKELESENAAIQQGLYEGELLANANLNEQMKEHKMQFVRYERALQKEYQTTEEAWKQKLAAAKKVDPETLAELRSEVSKLEADLAETIAENNNILQEKENRLSDSLRSKSAELEEQLKSMSNKVTMKKRELESLNLKVKQMAISKEERATQMGVLDQKLRGLIDYKSITEERLAKERAKLEETLSQEREKKATLAKWEKEKEKWVLEEKQLIQKKRERKNRARLMQFEIQILLRKLPVYGFAPNIKDIEVADHGDGAPQVSKDGLTCIVSKVVSEDLIDEFDLVFEESLKGVNNSIILLEETESLFRTIRHGILHTSSKYKEKWEPNGWNMKFSIQCVGICLTGGSVEDLIMIDADGSQMMETDNTAITFGKRDLKITSKRIDVSSDDLSFLSHVKEPNNTATLIAFHVDGTKKLSDSLCDASTFLLSYPGASEPLIDVVSGIRSLKYGSKYFEDRDLVTRVIHCLYANTEAITAINLKTKENLAMAGMINEIDAPPRKRFMRGL